MRAVATVQPRRGGRDGAGAGADRGADPAALAAGAGGGAGGRGLLPGRSDGVVRGAGGAGLRVRLGEEPAFEAGDRAAAAALAEPGAGHRTGLAAVPRFPLPDADGLEPEAARGGQGRVAARRGAREQPALRGDQPGAGTERDAGAVRAAVLCARGHGEPDQGAAAGPVRGSHLGGDDAGEPVAAVLGAVRGGHAGGAAAARAGGDGAGAGAVRDDPGIAAEGGGRGAGERAQGLGVVVVGVSTAGAVRAQPFAAAGGGAGIAGGPAADAAGAPRAAPPGKVCPKSANAPSSRAQCPGTGPAGREIGLREGIPVRPRPQSNCRSAPDSLCHGPRRPQPKLPTLGERFGLAAIGETCTPSMTYCARQSLVKELPCCLSSGFRAGNGFACNFRGTWRHECCISDYFA